MLGPTLGGGNVGGGVGDAVRPDGATGESDEPGGVGMAEPPPCVPQAAVSAAARTRAATAVARLLTCISLGRYGLIGGSEKGTPPAPPK
ncbi:hypothetical protein Asi02nite_35770 [Asanoa siamensis]|uniref:Uncharacterized protein n=1 Tax=Asanoa siamensis TaxID=926357 RepID=A0ABQ4CRZ0_9ACTN|nr:hypothetical protein Asi02nite_35770 [Asanoa siamensis]